MFPSPSALTLPPLNGAPPRDRAIVATLLYYDLFAFPLRADEVVRFAHRSSHEESIRARDVAYDSAWWDSRDALWFLRGREELTRRRAQLQATSSDKLARARKYARLLQLVPGVRFIGVTGSLAMESAVPEDDIDFLVIAQANRLWLTRALVLSALLAWGVKRPDNGGSAYPNLICANIFMDKGDLRICDQNLFIAHEICQMLPLLGEKTYYAFLAANAWVSAFLPQWQPAKLAFQDAPAWRRAQSTFETAFSNSLGARLERELASRQLNRIYGKHARGHNPNIKITPTQLRFHPRDLSDYVINTFNARWNELTQAQGKSDS